MTRIYDIRGTHGSGKSFLPWTLMFTSEIEELLEVWQDDNLMGYTFCWEEESWFVLGRYNEFGGGGCDCVSPPDEVCRRVRELAPDYDVCLLEGILVAHTFKRYATLAEEMIFMSCPYHFLFLDTPLATCIRRVMERRAKKGKPREFNTENLENDHRQITQNVSKKLHMVGHSVRWLNYENSFGDFVDIVRKDRQTMKVLEERSRDYDRNHV